MPYTNEEAIRIILEFVQSGGTSGPLEDFEKAFAQLAPMAERAQDKMNALFDTMERAKKAREEFARIGQIGTQLAATGAAITAPFLVMATSYVRMAGQTETASSRWIMAMRRVEVASNQAGRVVTQAVVPYLERAAELAEQAARWVEENPELVKLVLAAGTFLAASGGIIKVVSEVGRSVATIQQLTAATMMDRAADKQLIASQNMLGAASGSALNTGALMQAARLMIPIIGGLIIGSGIYDMIAARTGRSSVAEMSGQASSLMAGEIVGLLGGIYSVLRGGTFAAGFRTGYEGGFRGVGAGRDAGDAAERPAPGSDEYRRQFAQQNVQIFVDFQRSLVAAERNYNQQRTNIVEQFGRQRAQLEANYEASRARMIRDFRQSEKDAEIDYYMRRTQTARDYSIEVQRNEEDHQRRMAKLRADHDARMQDLVEQRDAVGIVKEKREYERRRQEEEDDYNTTTSRRHHDYALRISDMDAQYSLERERRLAQFTDQIMNQEEQYQEQLRMLEENKNETLRQLRQAYDEQTRLLREAFLDRIRAIDAYALDDYAAFQAHMASMSASFQQWLITQSAGFTTTTTTPITGGSTATRLPIPSRTSPLIRDTGGYSNGAGWRYLGGSGEEFTLDAATTRAAERMAGGRLNQQRMIAAMLGGAGGGAGPRTFIDQSTYNFSDAIGPEDRAWLRTEMVRISEERLTKALRN